MRASWHALVSLYATGGPMLPYARFFAPFRMLLLHEVWSARSAMNTSTTTAYSSLFP